MIATACEPAATGPGAAGFGPLRVLPVLESAVDPARLGLDSIRVTITRVDDGTEVADTILSFDADAASVLAWVLGLEGLPAMVRVDAEVLRSGTVMFAGAIEAEVTETPVADGATREVTLEFVGPGANVATLVVTPGDALLTFGDSVQYDILATDGDGRPVPNAVVVWSSSDPGLAPIDQEAVLEAPEARGDLVITAETPTGITGSGEARFQPPAGALETVGDDPLEAPVASVITLAVRVVGMDGLPVVGARVSFAAPPGASVAAPTAPSGPDGIASTDATLGTETGTQRFTASVPGIESAALPVTVRSGPPAALVFGTEPSSVAAGDWCGFAIPGDLPVDQRIDDGGALVFDTAPLAERVEILGVPEVLLELAADRPQALIAARLIDVAPDGQATIISRGVLNLTHRDGHEAAQPLVEGARYRVAVRLHDTAYAVPPGHRIRLSLSTAYWPIVWPSPGAAGPHPRGVAGEPANEVRPCRRRCSA